MRQGAKTFAEEGSTGSFLMGLDAPVRSLCACLSEHLSDFALLSLGCVKSDETSAKCEMGADFLRCHCAGTICARLDFYSESEKAQNVRGI